VESSSDSLKDLREPADLGELGATESLRGDCMKTGVRGKESVAVDICLGNGCVGDA